MIGTSLGVICLCSLAFALGYSRGHATARRRGIARLARYRSAILAPHHESHAVQTDAGWKALKEAWAMLYGVGCDKET